MHKLSVLKLTNVSGGCNRCGGGRSNNAQQIAEEGRAIMTMTFVWGVASTFLWGCANPITSNGVLKGIVGSAILAFGLGAAHMSAATSKLKAAELEQEI